MTAEAPPANQPHPAPYRDFIAFLHRIATDPGTSARLRRSLRDGDKISGDTWWLLGAWLPANHGRALIMARVAAWAASGQAVAGGDPVPRRTIAGEMAQQQIPSETARRFIEAATREGAPTSERLDRATRIIQQLGQPPSIDWARAILDFADLASGGQRAHAVRSRWYRDYYRNLPCPEKADNPTDNNGKAQ